MTKKEREQLHNIEVNYMLGVPDTKQAKKLGLSKIGFYQRVWSLRKKQLTAQTYENFE